MANNPLPLEIPANAQAVKDALDISITDVSGLGPAAEEDFANPPAIGDGTPNSGAFTTISATGTSTLPYIHGNIAGSLYIHVRNTSGGQLVRGTPVYIIGNVGNTDRVEVAAADHTDTNKMPAVGLLAQTLAQNGDGDAIIVGELTSANTNGYSIHQELFVGVGAIIGTKPTTGELQSVGVVSRAQNNTGVIVVNMQGRRTPEGLFATLPPVYANNAAAISGGLTSGKIYRTSTGALMVTY